MKFIKLTPRVESPRHLNGPFFVHVDHIVSFCAADPEGTFVYLSDSPDPEEVEETPDTIRAVIEGTRPPLASRPGESQP